MASNPDTARERQEEAAALALLAAGISRRYDLRALIAQTGRRPRPFRQIKPTDALKADLAAPYFMLVRAWAGEIDGLARAYAVDAASLERAVEAATIRAGATLATAQAQFAGIVAAIERWHRAQWVSRIQTSTGLDVTTLTRPDDVAADTEATALWNRTLADDVHRQVKHGLVTAFVTGLAIAAPLADARARADEVIAKARRRAANIADDQVDKVSRAMDRSRRAAAGLGLYRWHHTHQARPRPVHLTRDGKTYRAGDIAADDRAGVPPNCKCWEETLFD